ncbi:MAG: mannose-1-phosphate guanylyltransferase [Acidobacteriota bacterium]
MNSSPDGPVLFALVMAGGSGTRFWPMSRGARPKQVLPLDGGASLLASTLARLAPLIPAERTLVVTGREMEEAVRAEAGAIPAGNVLVEPVGRDTAACVGWAAWRLSRSHPGAVMVVVPADHRIPDGSALRGGLAAAAAAAFARGGLVTLGIRPVRPETGFGYLELGDVEGGAGGLPVVRVRRFVEKPDRARAEAMLASGNYRWNAGIFAWTVEAIRDAIRRHLPELAEGLDAMSRHADDAGDVEAVRTYFPTLPRVSIDFGVMEKAPTVWAVLVDFVWSDVGSWPALAEIAPSSPAGVTLGDVLAVDCDGCVLVSDGPAVAALGLHDLIVVATPGAVLVAPKADAQRVRELVEALRRAGREELL